MQVGPHLDPLARWIVHIGSRGSLAGMGLHADLTREGVRSRPKPTIQRPLVLEKTKSGRVQVGYGRPYLDPLARWIVRNGSRGGLAR